MSKTTDTVDIKAIIARAAWFKHLPEACHQTLAEASDLRPYSNNSFVFSAGEKTSDVYCIVDGLIRISLTSALGQEFTIVDLEADAWLNEVVLVNDDPRVLDAQVKRDALVLVVPRSVVQKIGDAHPEMYHSIFKDYANRTRRLYELVGGMLFYPLRVRLAGRFLELIKEHGEEADGGIYLNAKLSQNDFARYSLGSRQRINKIFREWNEQGTVIMNGDRYFVKNLSALQQELDLSSL